LLLEKLRPISQSEGDDDRDLVQTDAETLAGGNLSVEARTMLIEGSQDKNGYVLYHRAIGSANFITNGKDLCQDQSARSIARWKDALDALVHLGLLEERGQKGAVFALTNRGFEIADLLRGGTLP